MKFILLSMFGLLTGLAACGQTGPLHLPQDAPAKEHYLLSRKPADKAAEAAPEAAAEKPATAPPTP